MIALGSDHGGFRLKEEVKKYLDELSLEYKDFGTDSEERTDYPIYAEKVAKSIQNKECEIGILICKTGLGMGMVANKFRGIRAAVCTDPETSKQAKEHSNVNVLCLPGGSLTTSKAIQIIRVWLASSFLEGRYSERLQMIEKIENENMK